jgi:ubiquinone/menaquinone biosynthesis C-methylase UbiE
MNDQLKSLFKEDNSPFEIESAVYSLVPKENSVHHYDDKVNIYDAIIGNRFYNRLIWGNWPKNYRAFCRAAVSTADIGPVLDVGCGSLVFTHSVYSNIANRPLILLDRSIGMLLKGKQRLIDNLGEVPENICFLQADALNLPFKPESIKTVISFGLLHIFKNPDLLLSELMRVITVDGGLFATSLVANNWLSTHYLRALKNSGEVGTVHSEESLREYVSSRYPQLHLNSIGNMAYLGLQAADVDPACWTEGNTR